jgi:hypothetical protein
MAVREAIARCPTGAGFTGPILFGVLLLGLFACDDVPTPMLGIYTWGHEVRTFRSCGGTEVHWVQAPERVLQQLRQAHDSLTSEPYQGILVEAYLRHSADEPQGFARDYDGLIRVDSVLSVQGEIPDSCRDTTWALPGRRPTYFPR